jgi:hypothetical protein
MHNQNKSKSAIKQENIYGVLHLEMASGQKLDSGVLQTITLDGASES